MTVRACPGPDSAETLAVLTLSRVPGLGPYRIQRLLDRFESAEEALEACRDGRAIRSAILRDGEPRRIPRSIRAAARVVPDAREEELGRWKARGVRVLSCRSPGYPERLRELHDPPPILFLRGPADLSEARTVAIVGTRRATGYGRRMARELAGDLGLAGCTIASGMALGIDAAAHRGALGSGAVTIGVLGCGVERVYPPGNRRLFEEVGARGLLVSEFEPLTWARGHFFPRRNRIIAALADAVLVVQAGARSGAAITVDHALDLGRRVFIVPGPVDLSASAGVHRLLREGAWPVTCGRELLEDAGWIPLEAVPGPKRAGTDGPAARILHRLESGPRDRDELIEGAGLPVDRALALLARMELEGSIESTGGGRFASGARRARRSADTTGGTGTPSRGTRIEERFGWAPAAPRG